MKRIVLLATLAALGVSIVAASGASASTPPVKRTCITKSKNVTTRNVRGKLVGTNVDPLQARFATCKTARKVMNRILGLRIEKPKISEGFRCTPNVVRTKPDVVRYKCVFKGADTATFIRLTFTAKYDMD